MTMLRSLRFLADFSRKYPKCWQQVDMFIPDKGKRLWSAWSAGRSSRLFPRSTWPSTA